MLTYKSDTFGAIASLLCLVHCIATPIIFIAQTCSATCCEATPVWWQWMDYFFLIISFVAVYRSTQTTNSNWMRPALWLSWSALFLVILSEKLEWLSVEGLIYIPAIMLIGLHLYNQKYCQCSEDKCCASNK